MGIPRLISRRAALTAGLAALATRDVRAANFGEMAARAEPGDLVWYESNRRDQLDKIGAAFARTYPRLRLRPESIAGGVGIVGRVQQEYQAGTKTVDLVTLGGGGIAQMSARGLLRDVDWSPYGLAPAMLVGRHAVLTAASVYCLVVNTDQVSEADTPRDWDALLQPRWRGRIGTWVRAAAFAELAAVWGEERTTEYYRRFLAQNPMLFRSTAPLAQQVAAGEVAIGLGIHHTALAPLRRRAPLRVVMLDPTPISAIFTAVAAESRRPNASALFAAWLATSDGAQVYETETDRGNPLVEGTQAAKLLAGRRLAEWPMERKDAYAQLFERYNAMVNESEAR
jgi:iron(III) transport system substrate-binding protein